MVRAEMVERYGHERAYNSGFKVYTSVDSNIQQAAQDAIVDNLRFDMRHGYRGAAAQLWDSENESPLSQEEILSKLKDVKEFGPLLAGVVTNVAEQSIDVLLKTVNK